MGLRLITPPAVEPVTLDEVKAHLRVDTTATDANLAILIAAAREDIDGPAGWLGRAIVTQEWELSFDGFPTCGIAIPLAPLQTVSSVTYDDDAGDEQTIDAGDYVVDTTTIPPRITSTTSWPTIGTNPARVRFVAGYGDVDAVPNKIKAAIMLHTEILYDRPEGAQLAALERARDSLLEKIRIWSL